MAEATASAATPLESVGCARRDASRAYHFKLLIDGVDEGDFTRCTDLELEASDPSGGEGLAGAVPQGDMTLSHGVTRSPELWQWFVASMNGMPLRKNVSVLLLDPDGMTQKLRWNLNEAWPKKWRAAPLDALGQRIAIDSLTLVFESISRD
ncbi:phage tail protein [Myxococcus stipitatus]|uniref:phage tail protein n=1 Tax=Myxococcus stipitatus TaxID=83455 RepID=UPI001F30833E|nr:phage tail protein [Myxococcus stipitatus]MCE9673645.1 phage tail protein [Myxococcus stipitatus]